MLNLVAKKVFLTAGVGASVHKEKLSSFEYAWRDARYSSNKYCIINNSKRQARC